MKRTNQHHGGADDDLVEAAAILLAVTPPADRPQLVESTLWPLTGDELGQATRTRGESEPTPADVDQAHRTLRDVQAPNLLADYGVPGPWS